MSDLRQQLIDAGLLRPRRYEDGLRPVQLPPGTPVFRIHGSPASAATGLQNRDTRGSTEASCQAPPTRQRLNVHQIILLMATLGVGLPWRS